MSSSDYHLPVMVSEVLEQLDIRPEGVYLDLTFGGGGHTKAILERLSGGQLWAIDQDLDAMEEAKKIDDPRFHFIHGNFRFFKNLLWHHGVRRVDGILADLGTSSHQLNTATRGFAARMEGPLDMRMHQSGTTAASLLTTLSEVQLGKVLRQYGDVPNSRVVARGIVAAIKQQPILTVNQFKQVIQPFIPKHHEYKYLAKIFQALRIVVNDELGALEEMLLQLSYLLAPTGRVVILTYHSGEDRLVKRFFKTGHLSGKSEKDFYGNLIRPLRPIFNRALCSSPEEIILNNRSRSAKMRVATLNSLESE